MKKLSKIILIFAILLGVILMQSQVQATTPLVITSGDTNNTTNNVTNNAVNNTVNNVTNNTANNVTNNTINKVNNTTNTLPKTGIEDTPAGIIMIIGVVSAIYAYKKIRDYNV